MRLILIFDSQVDAPNATIKDLAERLIRAQNASKAMEKALEKSLGVDLDEVDIFEDEAFVLLREAHRDRLYTKES